MRKSLCAAVIMLAGASFLHASVIFSTLAGPQTGGYQVVGANAASGYPAESVAASFSSASAFVFTGAAVQAAALGESTFNMAIYASDAQGEPGAVLLTFGNNLTAPAASGVVSAFSSSNFTLAANTPYWLVLTPGTSTTQVSWGVVATAPTSLVSTTEATDGHGNWSIVGTEPVEFEIDGTPLAQQTPEPRSAWLVLIALPLLVGWRLGIPRRRA